jgi:hypothetical protein
VSKIRLTGITPGSAVWVKQGDRVIFQDIVHDTTVDIIGIPREHLDNQTLIEHDIADVSQVVVRVRKADLIPFEFVGRLTDLDWTTIYVMSQPDLIYAQPDPKWYTTIVHPTIQGNTYTVNDIYNYMKDEVNR